MRDKKKIVKYSIIIGVFILVLTITLVVYLKSPIQKLKNNDSGTLPAEVEKTNQENSNTTLEDNSDISTKEDNKNKNENSSNNENKTNSNVSNNDTDSSKDKNENVSSNNKVETNDTTEKDNNNSNSNKEQNNSSEEDNKSNTDKNNDNTNNDNANNNNTTDDKSESNNGGSTTEKEETTPTVDTEYERLKKIYRYETSAICYEESINVAFLFVDDPNFKHTACQSGAYKGQLVGYAILIYYNDNTTEYYMGN